MSRVLESVREEIADVEARLEKLREIEGMAVALNGGVPEPEPEIPKPPAAPRRLPPAARRLPPAARRLPAARVRAQRPKPSGQGRDGLSANAVKVLELIREAGDAGIRPNEIGTQLALDPSARKRATRQLVERGLIQGYGHTGSRVFKAPQGPGKARIAAKPTQTRKKADPKGGSVQGKVLEAVTYRAGSVAEIAQRLSLPIADVGTALRKMEREGEIRSRSVDGSLVWGSVWSSAVPYTRRSSGCARTAG